MMRLFVVAPLFFLMLLPNSVTCLTGKRVVSCADAFKPGVNESTVELYDVAFSSFEESAERLGKDTLSFESLIIISGIVRGGVDFAEAIVTARSIASVISSINVTLSEVKAVWADKWTSLANSVAADADLYQSDGDIISAASAYRRASSYLQLSERFADHFSLSALSSYNRSVMYFEKASQLDGFCQTVYIPYAENGTQYGLHAYICRSASSRPQGTILAMTGYDGSAETTVYSVAVPAVSYGFHVVVFEGPGQGYVARFLGLRFRPDWEAVLQAVVDFALREIPTPGTLIAWGRSFGGYLAPRGFAFEPRVSLLVADGGIYDFFQTLLCHLPEAFQTAYYTDDNMFDAMMRIAGERSLSLDFMLSFGALGFGTNAAKPHELFLRLQDFWMEGAMEGLAGRPILVNDPPLDSSTGNQSQLFFFRLPNRSPSSRLFSLDAMRGSGLHCGIGSTANSPTEILRWLTKNSSPSPLPPPSGGGKKHDDDKLPDWALGLIVATACAVVVALVVAVVGCVVIRKRRHGGHKDLLSSSPPLLGEH